MIQHATDQTNPSIDPSAYSLPDAGPGLWDVPRLSRAWRADKVSCLQRFRADYGDFVTLMRPPAPLTWLFVADPHLVEQVVVKQHSHFHKSSTLRGIEALVGDGLLISEGDVWRQRRKMAAPFLTPRQIASYAQDIVALTEGMMDGWALGQDRDLLEMTNALTLRIVVKTLLGVSVEGQIREVSEALEDAMFFFQRSMLSLWRFAPSFVPAPGRQQKRTSVARLHKLMDALIAQRRALPEGDDLLWRLIQARDDDGGALTDVQLRNEALTMFLAGHETTALAIFYTLRALLEHPEHMARAVAEVDATLGSRPARYEDLPKLTYLKAAAQEGMRLYPPAWIFGREVIEPVELGGHLLPVGAQIMCPVLVIQRDARWFPDPLAFKPDRWLDGSTEALPRFAYLPFGGGPRVCIGNHFAMMEIVLALATMLRRGTFRDVDPQPLRFNPSVTLRPATAMRLQLVSSRDHL